MMTTRLLARVAAGLATVVVMLPLSAPAEADVIPGCESAQPPSASFQPDLSTLDVDGTIGFLGHRVSVAPGSQWVDLFPAERRWNTHFHMMRWLYPIAVINPAQAVEIFLDLGAAVPDPGSSTTPLELSRTGWQESAVTTRLNVGRCLFTMTRDERLRPVVTALVEAAKDETRYYGPPRHRPHNHGLMSNKALYRAGATFDVPEWSDFAIARARADAGRVFDRCGLALEQSTGYQRVNVRMWLATSKLMGIRLVPWRTITAAQRSTAVLARPDGVVEAIGDSYPGRVDHPSASRLWCPTTGWAAGTVDSAHYTLRGGPRRWAHGHEDHGSMTWFAAGVPILSDRGYASKFDEAALVWSRGLSAHSVFEPVGTTTSGRTRMSVGPRFHYVLTDAPGQSPRRREITFGTQTLDVTDTASSADGVTVQTWIQHWQLSPGWIPDESGQGATFADGTRLDISCDGATVQFVAVQSYGTDHAAESAWDAQCAVTGTAVALHTVLTVTPPAKT